MTFIIDCLTNVHLTRGRHASEPQEVGELEDWRAKVAFCFSLQCPEILSAAQDRMKTLHVLLVVCLNIGVSKYSPPPSNVAFLAAGC